MLKLHMMRAYRDLFGIISSISISPHPHPYPRARPRPQELCGAYFRMYEDLLKNPNKSR